MSIFFFKSLMSLVILFSAILAMFSMFEVFGRADKKLNAEKLVKIHKINGIIYFVIFAVVAFFCLEFIVVSRAELSARSAFHGLFALLILTLMMVKMSYIRTYRQYYNQAKIMGLLMAFLTFAMVGTSAGYYLLVSNFGTDVSFDKLMQYKTRIVLEKSVKAKQTDPLMAESGGDGIGRGKKLFDSKCSFCHNAYSTETIVGPGLKGILKGTKLPFSNRKATPENIIRQLKQPINRMPSFDYLSEEEIEDLMAFLNTL